MSQHHTDIAAALTPVEVDEILAANYNQQARHDAIVSSQQRTISHLLKGTQGDESALPAYGQTQLARARQRAESALDEITHLRSAAAPYEAQFNESRWTRAFLVTNTNGHVHRSTGCRTCTARTSFSWLTQLSGMEESQIVEMAGERACTSCYPTAPVEVLSRPTQLFTPDETTRQQRQSEQARKRAEREAKRLVDPRTGDPLRGEYSEFKTERGAELEAISGLKSLAWYGADHPSADRWVSLSRLVAFAKSVKHGTSADAEFATLISKAARAHKRESGRDARLDVAYAEPTAPL